jgi:exopolysaccharide biosynthesis protein
MDGGGSTSMYIKGSGESLTDIINYPTDNHRHDHYGQRQTYTFILIKRKK